MAMIRSKVRSCWGKWGRDYLALLAPAMHSGQGAESCV